LTEEVFHYAKDSKKAAGRALGTLVEIITFYALKSWWLERNVAIEKPLPEFANDDIMHNVSRFLRVEGGMPESVFPHHASSSSQRCAAVKFFINAYVPTPKTSDQTKNR
jgi:hypothetical protein